MALDPAVEAQVEKGDLVVLELVRFDLPGKTVGYHRGGRPYTYNGLVYLPNRYLQPGNYSGELGIAVTAMEISFAGVPASDPNDIISQIENYQYQNSRVIVTYLCGIPNTDIVAGILQSTIYEINEVRFEESGQNEDGEVAIDIIVELEKPGRSARGATHVYRSTEDQRFDNRANDTCFEHASVRQTVPVAFGQIRG